VAYFFGATLYSLQDFQITLLKLCLLTCATQEEHSIDAQNPSHTCPLIYGLYLLHDRCRLSKVLDFGHWTQVLCLILEPRVLVNIPADNRRM